jgi:hypothetical protein
MNAKQLPKEIRNLQLVINTFEKRQHVVDDFSSKVGRLKNMLKVKENQLMQLPKVR